jgi:hypothetical protein
MRRNVLAALGLTTDPHLPGTSARRNLLVALGLTAVAAGIAGSLEGGNTDAQPKGAFAGLSAGQIADRAVKATTNAPTLRMSGRIPDDTPGRTVRFDLVLSRKGECSGTLNYAEDKTDMIRSAGILYVRYDEQFIRSEGGSAQETDALVELLADKWVKMPAEDPDVKKIARFCTPEKALRQVRTNATRGETTTIEGTPAIALQEKNAKQQVTATAYVATQGTPYLLRVDASTAQGKTTLQFHDFGKATAARKPKGDILDMATLTD